MNITIQKGAFQLSRLKPEKLDYLVKLATSQATARIRAELAEELRGPLMSLAEAEKLARSFEDDLINLYDLDLDGLECMSDNVRLIIYSKEALVVRSPLFVFSSKDSEDIFGQDDVKPTPTYCPPAEWFTFFTKDQYSSMSIAEPIPMKRWDAQLVG